MNSWIGRNGFIGRHHTLHAPVLITDIETGESYRADKGDDCRCSTDLSGYLEAISSGEVVCMGKTVFQPIEL